MGFTTTEITLQTLLCGVWNTFIKLAMPIAAVAILAVTGSSKVALLVPAVVGVAALVAAVAGFGLLMWRRAFARRIGAACGAGRVVAAAAGPQASAPAGADPHLGAAALTKAELPALTHPRP